MKVIFDHCESESTSIKTFYFLPETPLKFTAGQFSELTLPHENPDNRGISRWFTLSGSPKDRLLSITTRYSGIKSSSFKKALFNLLPGQLLTMSEAMGDFVLPKFQQTPLLFVAGGIGITPYHSIFAWLNQTNETRPIKLVYGVRSEDELLFLDTFDKAKQHIIFVVENPSDQWGGERGRLNADVILGLEPPDEDTLIYISGPAHMVESLQEELLGAGIKRSNLVLDLFPNYSSI